MSQLNANTPYIEAYLRKEYSGLDYNLNGFIFGVKSIINYPMLFHFQSNIGAVFWNMPINAFCHKEDYDVLDTNEQKRLSLLESWDCQSNSISTICFKFLQNKKVDIFCRDGSWKSGMYLFTIDDYSSDPNVINVGYSEDLDSKCFHFIQLDDGNFAIQPNNLIRWHNPDFIKPYDKNNPPKIKIKNEFISSEHVDLTYANSPYYIYKPENAD
jgi:hypothetical protein